jgi:hypothetical protein
MNPMNMSLNFEAIWFTFARKHSSPKKTYFQLAIVRLNVRTSNINLLDLIFRSKSYKALPLLLLA